MKFSLIQQMLPEWSCSDFRRTIWRLWAMSILGAALVPWSGCNRASREPSEGGAGSDHISQRDTLPPQKITRGVLKLQKSLRFPFEVPAHVIAPRIRGEFSSFVQADNRVTISDDSTNVELMIMTEEQFEAFDQKRSAESFYATEPSHKQAVDLTLPTTQGMPVRYYAVFRRSSDGPGPIWLKVDLTAEFEAPQP